MDFARSSARPNTDSTEVGNASRCFPALLGLAFMYLTQSSFLQRFRYALGNVKMGARDHCWVVGVGGVSVFAVRL